MYKELLDSLGMILIGLFAVIYFIGKTKDRDYDNLNATKFSYEIIPNYSGSTEFPFTLILSAKTGGITTNTIVTKGTYYYCYTTKTRLMQSNSKENKND